MNWLLIAVNTWIFFHFGTQPDYDVFVERWGFVPAQFDPVTMITSMFLHGSLMHLIGNMWFLYLFGDNVENRVGPFKYLTAYLLCGLAGDMCQYAFFPDSAVPSVGASGAIFGIMGMYLYFFPRNRVRIFALLVIIPLWFEVSALWVIGFSFVLELLYARAQTLSGVEGGIGHLAHTGGFAAGIVLAILYHASGMARAYGESLWNLFVGPMESDHRVDHW
jgi:membrane associated rhomboid family serine protease